VKPTPSVNSPERPVADVYHDASGLYRLLVDRVQDYAIFALDANGCIVTWNAGAQRLKGYTADEIIGKHFSIFYPPEDIAAGKTEKELEIARTTGRVEDEGWRLKKDGTRFWANVLITALRDDSGSLVGFAKVTRDLTLRRAAEQAIRDSEQRFRLLVDSVKDYAIFMLDPQGYVTTWNTGAQRIKGYTAAEIIGKHFSIFYAPDEAADKPERELATAINEGRYEEEGWRRRKDGTRFWANVVLTPVRDEHGTLAGFAKVTRDLTERRKAQEVEAANRTKSQFLAAMSHELRTPLNAIGGYTQLLAMGISGPVTDEQREQLERIQRSQHHLLGIINDILNFSRIEAGQVVYDIRSVPVREILEAVTPMILPQAKMKDLRLGIGACPPDLVVNADAAKLEQILINLLSNSVKFTEPGGTIELGCELNGDRVWISVRDTGIGIAEHELESIFAPFVQVGRNLANPKEGTGLGLAISRDLARAMHGDLTVQSQEGVGSTFTVRMPGGVRPPA
jgi:PAS domain S-box-containing protein